jgi:hypothetical protein
MESELTSSGGASIFQERLRRGSRLEETVARGQLEKRVC